jgi:transposase
MFSMPKAFPLEFRQDVVAVARKGQAPLAQVAKDFGVSEPCLQRWLKLADIEDGRRPGVTASESAELRELKKRNRLLEQEKAGGQVYQGLDNPYTYTKWDAGSAQWKGGAGPDAPGGATA